MLRVQPWVLIAFAIVIGIGIFIESKPKTASVGATPALGVTVKDQSINVVNLVLTDGNCELVRFVHSGVAIYYSNCINPVTGVNTITAISRG